MDVNADPKSMENRCRQHTSAILIEVMHNYSVRIENKRNLYLKTLVFEKKDKAIICRKSTI